MDSLRSRQITIGVDIGTTGCRSVAYTEQAEVVANAERTYPTLAPQPGWAEQDPEQVIAEVENSIRQVAAEARQKGYKVDLISFSAVNHAIMPVAKGKSLRPSIIWADNRSTPITEGWRQEGKGPAFYAATCCPIHPMYVPGKLAWLADQEPEVVQRTERFISIKELLFYRWFGRYVVDASIASASGLYNVQQEDWDLDILELTGISSEQLSEIVPTTAVFTGIKEDVRQSLGLEPEVQVVIGAGDGVLSSLGAGAVQPGEVTVMIGTSGAARITVSKPILDPQGRTWCYYLAPGAWVVGGAINNAGLTLQWVREKWLDNMSFSELEPLAARTAPGCDGLKLLPFLTGERSPRWDPSIRAALVGLDLAHGQGHFARAAMEGVAYRIKSVFEPIAEIAGEVNLVRIGGGFMRSATWVHILADVLDFPLGILGQPQGSAFGAVLLAWFATGKLTSLSDSSNLIKGQGLVNPDRQQASFYAEQYREYQQLYQKLYL